MMFTIKEEVRSELKYHKLEHRCLIAFPAALKSAKLKDEQVKKHTMAYVDMRKKKVYQT